MGKLGHLQGLLVHALADHGGITVDLEDKSTPPLSLLDNYNLVFFLIMFMYFIVVVSAQNNLDADGVAAEDHSSAVAAVVGGSSGHVAGPAQSKTAVDSNCRVALCHLLPKANHKFVKRKYMNQLCMLKENLQDEPRLAGGHRVDGLQVRRVGQHCAVHLAASGRRQVHGNGCGEERRMSDLVARTKPACNNVSFAH